MTHDLPRRYLPSAGIPEGWARKGNRITAPNGSYITRHELEHGVFYNCWKGPRGGCMDAGYGAEALARCIEACNRLGEVQSGPPLPDRVDHQQETFTSTLNQVTGSETSSVIASKAV